MLEAVIYSVVIIALGIGLGVIMAAAFLGVGFLVKAIYSASQKIGFGLLPKTSVASLFTLFCLSILVGMLVSILT